MNSSKCGRVVKALSSSLYDLLTYKWVHLSGAILVSSNLTVCIYIFTFKFFASVHLCMWLYEQVLN